MAGPFRVATSKPAAPRRLAAVTHAKRGFGQQIKEGKKRKEARFLEQLDGQSSTFAPSQQPGEGPALVRRSKPKGEFWFKAADLTDFEGKQRKAIVTASGRALMLWLVEGQVYCTDAASTAYAFPLVDAEIQPGPSGPSVVVPLDGTTYDLGTGKVLEWCPNNSPVRTVLSALKNKSDPVDLPVFDCALTFEDEVYVKLTKAVATGAIRV